MSSAASLGSSEDEAVHTSMKHIQTMTRLMLDSHQESMMNALRQESEVRAQATAGLQQRLAKLETDLSFQSELLEEVAHVTLPALKYEMACLREDAHAEPHERERGSGLHHHAISVDGDAALPTPRLLKSPLDAAAGTIIMADLVARVDALQEELRVEIAKIRIITEHSALRAGFLALAACECVEEDKRGLFNKLRAREDELLSRDPTAKQVDYEEWTVRLRNADGASLGIMTDGSDGSTLLVEEIDERDGLVRKWNLSAPEKAIQTGDRIISVNGKQGKQCGATALAEEVTRSKVLELRVRRIRSLPVFSSPRSGPTPRRMVTKATEPAVSDSDIRGAGVGGLEF